MMRACLIAVRSAAVLALPLAMAACGQDTARTLGFTRDAPDEFQVVTRAPLSMPPALGNLPPPRPGAVRPQELTASQSAESALVPSAALERRGGGTQSRSEASLVAQAGGGRPVDDSIRRVVDEESLRLDRPNRSLTDRLMFWQDPPPPGTALDPQRESQRLRENAALGRSPGDGETPVIQRRQPGLFERLF
ncbi:DUF3035 domain-containing protein [Roseomonas sp. OT10]|uniref:DUF3035 domain-containing protein n=1 Tax=Roseomonas cutis TaxID=2897332 RepID=UPI001E60CB6D|nr:DUF3035 domain-containing protein [Roseomonas sp. OT10]UFN46960.1 DUF3035 domain-containing protein [Roseomonas sp. OT10]